MYDKKYPVGLVSGWQRNEIPEQLIAWIESAVPIENDTPVQRPAGILVAACANAVMPCIQHVAPVAR